MLEIRLLIVIFLPLIISRKDPKMFAFGFVRISIFTSISTKKTHLPSGSTTTSRRTEPQPSTRSLVFRQLLYTSEEEEHINFHVSKQPPIRVGICGAGAISFGMAAMLSLAGHSPMLWSPSGAGTADFMGDNSQLLTATGAILQDHEEVPFTCRPSIARSCQELLQRNDVILIALPANGHKQVFDEMAPFVVPGRHSIIISSHASMGALYLAQLLLRDAKNTNKPTLTVPITAWGTTVCTARRIDGTTVKLNTIRQSVDLCTIPDIASASALALCKKLFPRVETFCPRQGLLAISLSNLNPQNHLGIALGNMSRMEKGEKWYQLYHITPNIGRFLQSLEKERLNIAEALNLETKTIFEHFSQGFHVPISSSISEMNQEIYRQGKDVFGPITSDSRYVTEDVPYGLALTIILGRMVNRPAPLHLAGLQIMSAMYGVDFLEENDLLTALNLEQYSLQDLKEASYSGVIQESSMSDAEGALMAP